MTARNQNFEMFCGDTREIVVTVRDASGSAIDLTGATVLWTLSRSDRCDAEVSKSSPSEGIVLTSAASGQFTITLDADDTEDLDPGDYYHEAEVTDSSGRVSTVLTGRARLLASVA
jgi:hypothetical protein